MQFSTQRGVVVVVDTGPTSHGVFRKDNNEYFGVVVEEHDGVHIAYPADDRSPRRCDTLQAAVLWIGEDR